MISMALREISDALGGSLIGDSVLVDNVFTDSRMTSLPNRSSLFVALKGPFFDAHNYLESAQELGAAAAIVEKKSALNIPQIVVENSKLALAQLAALNRQKSNAKYVAITGSSGKTTTKEMVASILSLAGSTFATLGNLNNDIGVPLSLLEIDESIEFGVLELGANHVGEIAYTAELVKPDVALVNNVGAAHLEGFGDLQGVAEAKSEIYAFVKKGGKAIVNLDDNFSAYFLENISSETVLFSHFSKSDIYAQNVKLSVEGSTSFELYTPEGNVLVNLPLAGEHNVSNALAAASCCLALGVSLRLISKGLASTPTVKGRQVVNNLDNGVTLIDDTYNANLASMKAAIDLLKQYPEPRVLVIGDMGELGSQGSDLHKEIGDYAFSLNITQLFCFGPLSLLASQTFDEALSNTPEKKGSRRTLHFDNQKELIEELIKEARFGHTILVKGSRTSQMEKIVEAILSNAEFASNSNSNFSTTEKLAASLQGEI